MNKVIMIGHLTKAVELKYLITGKALANTTIAINENHKNDKDEQITNVCFIDLIIFGKNAEIANQYLNKGSHIAITGKLNFEIWQDKQGNTKSKHSIIVESLEFLNKKSIANQK